jgi:hydrogenase expression/formation protein HypE
VNDLAMAGAVPHRLSCSMIIEEGLRLETLAAIVDSMAATAVAARASVVTGDTKVVEHGSCDGLYINTAGIGLIPTGREVVPQRVTAGDTIVISGDIGRHGIAVMSVRQGLAFETTIESDCALLTEPVELLFGAGIDCHCLRDLTRGGLGAALIEIAETTMLHLDIDETAVPISDQVRGACEILGLDPLYVACEGRFVAFVPADQSARAVDALHDHALGVGAKVVGTVVAAQSDERGLVTSRSSLGTRRVLDLPLGDQLPRIC